MMILPPLALYIHFPWCTRKCPYCDFNSHKVPGQWDEASYITALLDDLDHDLARLIRQGGALRPLVSLFLGGGTPSLFSGAAIQTLLTGIQCRIPFTSDVEITLEANPGSADTTNFRAYRQAGVNRLSLGIQSFDDRCLQAIGRIHDGAAALQAVALARAAGFDNLNLDLMFGLPRQAPAEAARDLDQALACQPEHLSYYQLTLEPHTRFAHAPPPLPDDESLWAMQQQAETQLAAAGFEHYEVSAYAQAGYPCRHNLNYWIFGDYLGIGAGAHAKLTHSATGQIWRHWKSRDPARYLTGAYQAGESLIPPQERLFEFLMNALRLTEGFSAPLLTAHTGLPLETLAQASRIPLARGLLETTGQEWRATPQGARFLNDLLQAFL